MRRNIYKWHRTLSLIIALPVVLWAASGFMHPLMTTIRPVVITQALRADVIDSNRVRITLPDALAKNKIDSFEQFRFIHIDTNWFYQVQTTNAVPVYLSTTTGKKLPDGDVLYARYIAKQFLEGQPAPVKTTIQYASVHTDPVNMNMAGTAAHDCCDAATTSILLNKTGSQVNDVSLLTTFNDEYKFINRLLPVYKVNFNRADGIRIYVETTHDRFAFAVDNKRAVFDKLFGIFHTWEWMNGLGNIKYFLMMLLTGTAFLTTLMGLYIFFITKSKKPNGNALVSARRRHRWTSFSISLFTLMFTGSGAFHAFLKCSPDITGNNLMAYNFSSQQAALHLNRVQAAAGPFQSITNVSIVRIGGLAYWQVFMSMPSVTPGHQDLMLSMAAPPPATLYLALTNNTLLPDGEEAYAAALATGFSRHAGSAIKKKELITKFEGEYGFVNKRLPVWKISYNSNSHERFYVETSSGKLAAVINDNNLIEGYSFALLHKHEFMTWAGKPVKDFSTMFWATAQIAMVVVGLMLYIKMKRRKKQGPVV